MSLRQKREDSYSNNQVIRVINWSGNPNWESTQISRRILSNKLILKLSTIDSTIDQKPIFKSILNRYNLGCKDPPYITRRTTNRKKSNLDPNLISKTETWNQLRLSNPTRDRSGGRSLTQFILCSLCSHLRSVYQAVNHCCLLIQVCIYVHIRSTVRSTALLLCCFSNGSENPIFCFFSHNSSPWWRFLESVPNTMNQTILTYPTDCIITTTYVSMPNGIKLHVVHLNDLYRAQPTETKSVAMNQLAESYAPPY